MGARGRLRHRGGRRSRSASNLTKQDADNERKASGHHRSRQPDAPEGVETLATVLPIVRSTRTSNTTVKPSCLWACSSRR